MTWLKNTEGLVGSQLKQDPMCRVVSLLTVVTLCRGDPEAVFSMTYLLLKDGPVHAMIDSNKTRGGAMVDW